MSKQNIITNESFVRSRAICLQCGSTKSSTKTALCINDHDDWLELVDHAENFGIALKKFKVPMNQIILSIRNGIDLTIIN